MYDFDYQYHSDISKSDYLTREQEIDLFKKMQNGDREDYLIARDKLFRSQYLQVCKFASKYMYRCKHLLMDDLIQEGCLGLLTAIEMFDLTKETRLSTYSYNWIQAKMLRAIKNKEKCIRLPVNMGDAIMRILRAQMTLEKELCRLPQEEEIIAKTGLAEKSYKMTVRLMNAQPISLETPVGSSDDVCTLMDMLPDEKVASCIDYADEFFLHEKLAAVLDNLSEKQRYIICQRFGLNESRAPRTLEDIAIELNVTRERIRQLEEKALRRLRASPVTMRELIALRA